MAAICLLSAAILSCLSASSQNENLLQFEDLLHQSYAERAPALWQIGDSVFLQKDSALAFTIADRLIEFGRKNKDAALQLEGELYKVFYLMEHVPVPKERIITTFKGIIRRAAASNSREVEWKARLELARYYFYSLQAFEIAFRQYNELYRLLQPVSFREFPDKVRTLYFIGTAYYYFQDYKNAIKYFRENRGLDADRQFRFGRIHSVNFMAAAYRKLGMLDSSDYYCHVLYKFAEKQNDSIWMGIVKGDLGYNEYLRGRFKKAEPLLNYCATYAIVCKDWRLAAEKLMTLADIYFRQNKIPAATTAVLQARDYINRLEQDKYLQFVRLYPLLGKMYAYRNNPALSERYIDSAAFVADSLHRRFNGLLLARALQNDVLVREREKQQEIESRKKLLTVQLYGLLIIAGLAFVATLFIFRHRKLKHKQEQLLKDMQLKEKEKELQLAEQQLLDLARHLSEKNVIIQKFRDQQENTEAIRTLEQTVILTGQDWGRFRELFEQVHPGYLDRLAQKIPGITPAETRLMTLARLNFSNKEMAAALGVTKQAIRVTWHRLRKKANLAEECSITELANQV